MVWFNVDDGFMTSTKVLSIPRARRIPAVGVWTLLGTWSARNLTDGRVPKFALDELPGAAKFVPDLVAARLWSETDDGWQFNKWEQYQRTRVQVLKERAGNAARQQSFRDKRNAVTNGVTSPLVTPPVTVVVTAPIPSPAMPYQELQQKKKSTSSVRATRLPEDWEPSLDLIGWVRENCPNVDGKGQTARFKDYWISKAGTTATKRDWPATYRNWMREAQDRAPGRPPERAGSAGNQMSTGTQRAMAAVEAARQVNNFRHQIEIGAS